ncbi:MAG: hypothetical protein WD002_08110 [Pseudomonadales bacterium]
MILKFEGVVAHPAPSLCEYMSSLVHPEWDFDTVVTGFFASRQSWDSYFTDSLHAAGVAVGEVLPVLARANRALAQAQAWQLYDDVPLALDWMSKRQVPVGIVADWPVDAAGVLRKGGVTSQTLSIRRMGALSDALWSMAGHFNASAEEMIYVGADYGSDYEDARTLGCHALLMDRLDEFDETVPNVNHLIEIELYI